MVVLGATDRLEAVDPAVRQKLEQEVAMGIPDQEARRKILEVRCKGIRLDEGTVDLDHLARMTPGKI